MTDIVTMDVLEMLRKRLEEAGSEQLKEMVRFLAESLMDAEADAAPRTTLARRRESTSATGRWDTRTGSIDLAIPKLRRGSYFPD